MKNLINFLGCLLLLACSEVELAPTKTQPLSTDPLTSENQISTLGIGPVSPYVWTKLQVPLMNGYPWNNPNGENLVIQANGETYCIIGSVSELNYKLNKATKHWESTTDHMPAFYGGFQYLFSLGSKIYFGLQIGHSEYDFGSIDVTSGVVVSLAAFPGIPVYYASCFVIGSKGYLMGGYSETTHNVVNQFWEYDFATNLWSNKGQLPGGSRAGASALVIDDKVYFGLGYDYLTFNGQTSKRYKSDWYQLNPATYNGYSAIKANFPQGRSNAKGFVINNKIYLGWGQNKTGSQNDLWEYNPTANTWAQKATCPATNQGYNFTRSNIGVFSVGKVGYLIKGDLAEFWRYSNSSLVPTN